ncbi:MAG: hypothetical protein Q8P16_02660, partial [bacterium]|nr:hypothetical protein [bacterium]
MNVATLIKALAVLLVVGLGAYALLTLSNNNDKAEEGNTTAVSEYFRERMTTLGVADIGQP